MPTADGPSDRVVVAAGTAIPANTVRRIDDVVLAGSSTVPVTGSATRRTRKALRR